VTQKAWAAYSFDHSGNWSRPYRQAGYHVLQHDGKLGQDIFEDTIPFCNLLRAEGITVHGILAAVPCTEFASSGARWWKAKDLFDNNRGRSKMKSKRAQRKRCFSF
jgi:hypothetical protein